jgi:hypothetical protein
VLDGRGEVVADGVPHAFEAGDAVYNAPNSVHTVRNTGGEPLRLLVVGGIMFVGCRLDPSALCHLACGRRNRKCLTHSGK